MASVVGLLVALACGPASEPTAGLSRLLPALAAEKDTVVVLMYDPADCFSCSAPYGAWLSWERGGESRRVNLLLSRQPSRDERTQLDLARLAERAILDQGRGPGNPVAWVFVRGIAVDSAKTSSGMSRLVGKYVTPPVTKDSAAGRSP